MEEQKELSFEDEKMKEALEKHRKKSQAIKEMWLAKCREILNKTPKKRTKEEWDNFDIEL